VLPHRETSVFRRLLERPLVDRLVERLPDVEVHVVGANSPARLPSRRRAIPMAALAFDRRHLQQLA
jgi:hypothetical protein